MFVRVYLGKVWRVLGGRRPCSEQVVKQRRYGDAGRVPYTYQARWSSLVTDSNSVKSNHNEQVGLRRSEGGKSGREEEGRDVQETQFRRKHCFVLS